MFWDRETLSVKFCAIFYSYVELCTDFRLRKLKLNDEEINDFAVGNLHAYGPALMTTRNGLNAT